MPVTIFHSFSSSTYRASRLHGIVAIAIGALLAACSSMSVAPSAPTLSDAQIAMLLAAPDRSDADRANAVRRKPAQLLVFVGVRPGMNVLDISTGGGYSADVLARAVGPNGHVYGVSLPRDPARPMMPDSAKLLADRAQKPAAAALASAIVPSFSEPIPSALKNQAFDLVTLMYNYHDFAEVDRARMNLAVFDALKSGGLYVIADHSGRPGTGISESHTLHRIEESFLRKEVEAAGFKFIAEGGFLRNPADPRDEKSPAQGKDEFIVKFVKP